MILMDAKTAARHSRYKAKLLKEAADLKNQEIFKKYVEYIQSKIISATCYEKEICYYDLAIANVGDLGAILSCLRNLGYSVSYQTFLDRIEIRISWREV